jgi:alkylation response protein AidB-like acyl-CoA dehydrogenase
LVFSACSVLLKLYSGDKLNAIFRADASNDGPGYPVVNFDFSDEQKALQSEVRRFLSDRSNLSVARAVLDDASLSHSEAVWHEMLDLGWAGIAIPEQYGGVGLGYLELCVMAQELGRSLAPVPFSSTVYQFCEAVLRGGNEEQRYTVLARVAAGETIGTLAFAEGMGFPAPDRIKLRCEQGRLHGEKWPVPDAMIADAAVVLAVNENNEPCLCLVNLAQDGVQRRSLESIDPTRNQGALVFDGAEAQPLGKAGDSAWAVFRAVLDAAAVLFAFEQVGGAEACLQSAIDFANERNAFGRPIASLQAIKHKLADVYVGNQLALSNAYYGAWALASGSDELPLAAAVARVSATEAYENAATENVQVHGGMGFTWEADCHLFLRRSRSLALLIGDLGMWKKQVTAEFERKVA